MSKPLTITISDGLYKRLQAVKNQINVSGECQEAIEREVSIQELKIKEIDNMDDAVIERLIAEKESYDQQYENEGKIDGLKDAKELSYDDFMEIAAIADSKDALEREPGISWSDMMQSLWGDLAKTNVWYNFLQDQIKEIRNDDSKFSEEGYIAGWIDGVNEYFESIKDQL